MGKERFLLVFSRFQLTSQISSKTNTASNALSSRIRIWLDLRGLRVTRKCDKWQHGRAHRGGRSAWGKVEEAMACVSDWGRSDPQQSPGPPAGGGPSLGGASCKESPMCKVGSDVNKPIAACGGRPGPERRQEQNGTAGSVESWTIKGWPRPPQLTLCDCSIQPSAGACAQARLTR